MVCWHAGVSALSRVAAPRSEKRRQATFPRVKRLPKKPDPLAEIGLFYCVWPGGNLLSRAECTLTSAQPRFTVGKSARASQAASALQRLRLERRELSLAAHGHDAHLAGTVDRHHHRYLVAALEQRDVADFRAAHRQIEDGPSVGAGIEPDDAVRGPQVAPHPVLAVDRDVIGLHRWVRERNDRRLESLGVDLRPRRPERIAHPQE